MIRKFLTLKSFYKKLLLQFIDSFLIILSSYLSISVIRGELEVFSKALIFYGFVNVFIYISVSFFLKIHNNINRYFDLRNLIQIFKAFLILIFLNLVISLLSNFRFYNFSNIALTSIFSSIFIINLRLFIKSLYDFKLRTTKKTDIKCAIYGAGLTGAKFFDYLLNFTNEIPVFFIDESSDKIGRYLKDIKIVGPAKIQDLIENEKIKKIYLCINSLNSLKKNEIKNFFKNIKVEFIDASSLVYNNKEDKIFFNKKNILDANFNDLKKKYKDKTIFVTGGAGSIGEEICFQLLKFEVKKLIILDKNELAISKLNKRISELSSNKVEIYLSDITNYNIVEKIFLKHNPDIVFHAAAYKHVEICEENPLETIYNNCVGIINIAKLSFNFKVKNFVFISTDKAVNPINIMGKTKRFGEIITDYYNRISDLERTHSKFISVRFGNVIGSSGSLIPKIQEQISKDQEVFVTSKEATRYFMTISDSVSLVLSSLIIDSQNSIFVLKMGEAINIYQLVKKIVSEHEISNKVKIKINICGLRKGEKLHEELFYKGNESETSNKLILSENTKKYMREIDIVRILNEINYITKNASIDDDIINFFKKYI